VVVINEFWSNSSEPRFIHYGSQLRIQQVDDVGDIVVNTVDVGWEENEWIAKRNFSNLIPLEKEFTEFDPGKRVTKGKAEKRFRDLQTIFGKKPKKPTPTFTSGEPLRSQYIGVHQAASGEWYAERTIKGKLHRSVKFYSELDAAYASDDLVKEHRTSNTKHKLNFPERYQDSEVGDMTWKTLPPPKKKKQNKTDKATSQETKKYPKRSSRFYTSKQKQFQDIPPTIRQSVGHKSKTNDRTKKSDAYEAKKNDHTKTSSYNGVRWYEKDQKWWVAHQAHGDLHFGGLHKSEKQAAKASDSLARSLGFPESEMNFPKKTSKYVGVRWDTRSGKWHVQRNIGNQIYMAGKFEDEIAAARASDELVFTHADASHSSKLNFQYTNMPKLEESSKPKQKQSVKMDIPNTKPKHSGEMQDGGSVISEDAKKSKFVGVRWHRNRWQGEIKIEGATEHVSSGISQEAVAAEVLQRRREHEERGVVFTSSFGERWAHQTKAEASGAFVSGESKRHTVTTGQKTTKFSGIFWDRKENQWRVVRKIDGKMFVGGKYTDEYEAALAADRLVQKYASSVSEHTLNYPPVNHPPPTLEVNGGKPTAPIHID